MKVAFIAVVALFLFNCKGNFITGITKVNKDCETIQADKDDWCGQFGPACPNPTNTFTDLTFSIPKDSFVELIIIDKNKDTIATLIAQLSRAGSYLVRWELNNDKGNRVNPGLYRAQLYVDSKFICHGDIQVSK